MRMWRGERRRARNRGREDLHEWFQEHVGERINIHMHHISDGEEKQSARNRGMHWILKEARTSGERSGKIGSGSYHENINRKKSVDTRRSDSRTSEGRKDEHGCDTSCTVRFKSLWTSCIYFHLILSSSVFAGLPQSSIIRPLERKSISAQCSVRKLATNKRTLKRWETTKRNGSECVECTDF